MKNHFAKMLRSITIKEVNEISSEYYVIETVKVNSQSTTWYEMLNINDVKIKFKIDTGAQGNIITVEKLKRLSGFQVMLDAMDVVNNTDL